jgi:hypothetical protein
MKGKQKAVKIFECIDGDAPDQFELKMNTLEVYDDAISKFFKKEFAESRSAFEYILKENPDDPSAKRMLEKLDSVLKTGVEDDWIGVEEMFKK